MPDPVSDIATAKLEKKLALGQVAGAANGGAGRLFIGPGPGACTLVAGFRPECAMAG